MNRKCFFVDVDGTIVDTPNGLNQPSKYTRYAFKELCKNHNVFINSGRSMPLLQDFVRNLNPTGYVLSNGAYSEINGKEIHHKAIDEGHIDLLKEYCIKNNCVYFRETIDKVYVGNIDLPLMKRFVDSWNIEDVFTKDDNGKECYLFMPICDNEEIAKDFEERFKEIVDVRRQYGFTSFDVCDFGMNKGYGTKKVIEYLNVPLCDTYAFGDGLNDLEMIENVGHGIAMANAKEKVKMIAEEITDDVLNDGLYNYLVRHELIKPLNE